MGNGRIQFEIKDGEYAGVHHLHFGMSAIRIYQEKVFSEIQGLSSESPKTKLEDLKADPVKSFAYLIYAGLCNYADIQEKSRPTYQYSYSISEEILYMDDSIQNDIWVCFSESRAGKDLLDKLPKPEKKSEAESQSKQIGTE